MSQREDGPLWSYRCSHQPDETYRTIVAYSAARAAAQYAEWLGSMNGGETVSEVWVWLPDEAKVRFDIHEERVTIYRATVSTR